MGTEGVGRAKPLASLLGWDHRPACLWRELKQGCQAMSRFHEHGPAPFFIPPPLGYLLCCCFEGGDSDIAELVCGTSPQPSQGEWRTGVNAKETGCPVSILGDEIGFITWGLWARTVPGSMLGYVHHHGVDMSQVTAEPGGSCHVRHH